MRLKIASTNQRLHIALFIEFWDNGDMALIGYARVSTNEQHLHLQRDALTAAGCLKIFTDTISGVKTERKGLAEALNYILKNDTMGVDGFITQDFVWFSRLGISTETGSKSYGMLRE